ncbi:hypothetical protein TNCV_276201 [Trichonephila clavipes]|nr:hypothetical protein TNCV_276201 [Trichonephila clavipes]
MVGICLGSFDRLSVGRLYRESVSAHIVSSQTRCRHRIVRKRKHNIMVSPLTVGIAWGKKGQNFCPPIWEILSQQFGKRLEFSHVCRHHS